MASVRPAVVAGLFYPGDPQALHDAVDELLGTVGHPGPRLGFPKVLVVPHAGYVYSGAIAARAYDEVAAGRGVIRRVVLLGPAHRVPVRGLAVPTVEAFHTPLGPVRIDRAALHALRDLPQVVASDRAHAMEHSLEVQLPFLQKVLDRFTLVPLALGMASVQEVAEVIERLWGGPETLIVVSSDLSHYHDYEQARRIDGATVQRIAAGASDLTHDEACGATALNGMLSLATRRGLSIHLLGACNSGDTAGDKQRVVGYSAFAMREGNPVSETDAGRTLIGLARQAIDSSLNGGAAPDTNGSIWLRQAGATFVTLVRSGTLRGCIGSLDARRPLGEDVTDNARGAAFRDPRFPGLTSAEWPACRVEVSLLSPPRPLRFVDEDALHAQLQPGVDGLILEADGKRGTFLPQVWESLPDSRLFIRELVKKAGLPPDTPLVCCKFSRYRVAKWKEIES